MSKRNLLDSDDEAEEAPRVKAEVKPVKKEKQAKKAGDDVAANEDFLTLTVNKDFAKKYKEKKKAEEYTRRTHHVLFSCFCIASHIASSLLVHRCAVCFATHLRSLYPHCAESAVQTTLDRVSCTHPVRPIDAFVLPRSLYPRRFTSDTLFNSSHTFHCAPTNFSPLLT